MRMDDEPLDSLPIPNPCVTHFIWEGFYFWDSVKDDGRRLDESHVEVNASIVAGGRVMNSFVEQFRPWR